MGKSWLLLRWAGETGKFSKSAQSMPTIGIDFKMKNININGKRVKIQIVSLKCTIPIFTLLSISSTISGTQLDKKDFEQLLHRTIEILKE